MTPAAARSTSPRASRRSIATVRPARPPRTSTARSASPATASRAWTSPSPSISSARRTTCPTRR
ncbi:MAG: hypothetical protein DYG94_06345 [Leptolyngbya sp. PLA3]|nr:MAG: hypothetical protein EDM82_05625 [Cyanobacteria bacterium CYA]MCE7968349.1 hypothetical protein [Leptolyngbya sp. PL-A3]